MDWRVGPAVGRPLQEVFVIGWLVMTWIQSQSGWTGEAFQELLEMQPSLDLSGILDGVGEEEQGKTSTSASPLRTGPAHRLEMF